MPITMDIKIVRIKGFYTATAVHENSICEEEDQDPLCALAITVVGALMRSGYLQISVNQHPVTYEEITVDGDWIYGCGVMDINKDS